MKRGNSSPSPRRKILLALGGVLLLGLVVISLWPKALTDDPNHRDWEPLPRRVEVQVLNGGSQSGLARAMTVRIRSAGLDVVLFGDARDSLRDEDRRVPLVLIRRGDSTGVGRLRELFDSVEVRVAPDARPLVDLTVVFGGAFGQPEPVDTDRRSTP